VGFNLTPNLAAQSLLTKTALLYLKTKETRRLREVTSLLVTLPLLSALLITLALAGWHLLATLVKMNLYLRVKALPGLKVLVRTTSLAL
jgi:hypothetical protein